LSHPCGYHPLTVIQKRHSGNEFGFSHIQERAWFVALNAQVAD
jgi:hypothetical protein